ncbi:MULTISPECIES: NADH-quinone oxidoreductase subunit NuoE [unclassified Candidatus Frackibacter]|uniref:NADH-quinone oxidoreductase subunit NuoE n=1 Tax=unclassified Candidatus Frackibacter TaxID=2648818 RepID=UPI0007948240|nr:MULTISPECIES: NADH-quinone oxidoreductase subunit NuoE [unclassified Candidatus Frackibacter]KXS44571.1 MAG: NADH-quinone oxidoreductase subunit E [Candidatus Frackibacter sp. T328-2]SDC37904.1 NADH-quinone oxidoreductase subunit E [Candidatus Frackibacter sp. WG11]SEM62297.1 NADH-quinone oxidoreductase subunit E [Candidatus Frackibacter sp. WG12]SFL65586.1 NADH-quinone oxidoreductase subunit E [Candidatus Frackibacter sp. WG13]
MTTCQCGDLEENKEKYLAPLKEILENYDQKEEDLIPVLQDAQEEYGYLPKVVLREIADSLDIFFSDVYGVTTFYSQFHLEPRGENVIKVCLGTACHVRGGARILERLQDELGIADGETTEDLKFTLESVACIGACGLAPVMMINDDTHGLLTPGEVPKILDQYNQG